MNHPIIIRFFRPNHPIHWRTITTLDADTKGGIYEGILEKNAEEIIENIEAGLANFRSVTLSLEKMPAR